VDFSVVLARTCSNVRGHVAIITETESTYIMIESTLQFDDVEDIPGLLPLLQAVQRSRMWSREGSRRWPGNEAIIVIVLGVEHVAMAMTGDCQGIYYLLGLVSADTSNSHGT